MTSAPWREYMYRSGKHLGGIYPFYEEAGDVNCIQPVISEFLSKSDRAFSWDTTSLIDLFSFRHLIGDKTLIKGISRIPWRAEVNRRTDEFRRLQVSKHGNLIQSPKEIAENLVNLLSAELLHFIGDSQSIGILLSGGMDSRIVAAVLKHLINKGYIKNSSIYALTWGDKDSRDVVYAKNIAKLYNWSWSNFTVGAEQLYNNIYEAAKYGGEYSAFHLHALPQIRDSVKLDCIIAGSYGDSIGRAEYSGRHVTQLIPFERYSNNRYRLILDDVFNSSKRECLEYVRNYRFLYIDEDDNYRDEIDYQCHYMRRMLNSCMEIVSHEMPIFQSFTSPEVFEYMWSLAPECRNDLVYKYMLEILDRELLTIPWARTGKLYMDSTGPLKDSFRKSHHRYSDYFQRELQNDIRTILLNGSYLHRAGINLETVKLYLDYVSKGAAKVTFDLQERLLLAMGIELMGEMYKVRGVDYCVTFHDKFNARLAAPLRFMAKKMLKN